MWLQFDSVFLWTAHVQLFHLEYQCMFFHLTPVSHLALGSNICWTTYWQYILFFCRYTHTFIMQGIHSWDRGQYNNTALMSLLDSPSHWFSDKTFINHKYFHSSLSHWENHLCLPPCVYFTDMWPLIWSAQGWHTVSIWPHVESIVKIDFLLLSSLAVSMCIFETTMSLWYSNVLKRWWQIHENMPAPVNRMNVHTQKKIDAERVIAFVLPT